MPLRGEDVVRIMEGFVGVDVVIVASCRRLVGLIIRGVRGGRFCLGQNFREI